MAPPSKAPPAGLVWPLVPGKTDDRSSTWTNKQVLAAAVKAADPELAKKLENEPKWRQKYVKYIYQHVQSSLKSKEAAVASAQAGLEWAHNNFEFIRDGKTLKLAEAMSTFKSNFETQTVKGTKVRNSAAPLQVPYHGTYLAGADLTAQVDQWVSYGTIEPSAGDAIKAVAQNGQWRDLSDKYFVLLGAGSAMGPLSLLLELGANVIAIDLDRPAIWHRLLSMAQKSAGTMTFPVSKKQPGSGDDLPSVAGCNLLTQTPEILDWLKSVHPGKPLVVGAYAYLDGELHVRVSLAMDAIIKGLTESRKNVTPAYLCTPTDVHVIPSEAYQAQRANYASLRPANLGIKLSPFYWFGMLKKNAQRPVKAEDGTEFYLVDGLVNKQGPNYALAKRMQHWRAVVAREERGCRVSSNIAPSTATASVVHNKMFAAAYKGMHWFTPMEVFQQETSNAVMGALLIADLQDNSGPQNPKEPLKNPLQLFSFRSFHGGVWRMAFKIDSIGEAAVVFFALEFIVKRVLRLFVSMLVFAVISYVATGKDHIGVARLWGGKTDSGGEL